MGLGSPDVLGALERDFCLVGGAESAQTQRCAGAGGAATWEEIAHLALEGCEAVEVSCVAESFTPHMDGRPDGWGWVADPVLASSPLDETVLSPHRKTPLMKLPGLDCFSLGGIMS